MIRVIASIAIVLAGTVGGIWWKKKKHIPTDKR
jgi:hypothetical protein